MSAGINLTEVVLTHDQRSLLNLGPKFVPTKKSVALNLEYHNKEADAESLHQNVVIFLTKHENQR